MISTRVALLAPPRDDLRQCRVDVRARFDMMSCVELEFSRLRARCPAGYWRFTADLVASRLGGRRGLWRRLGAVLTCGGGLARSWRPASRWFALACWPSGAAFWRCSWWQGPLGLAAAAACAGGLVALPVGAVDLAQRGLAARRAFEGDCGPDRVLPGHCGRGVCRRPRCARNAPTLAPARGHVAEPIPGLTGP